MSDDQVNILVRKSFCEPLIELSCPEKVAVEMTSLPVFQGPRHPVLVQMWTARQG